jgi:hypothetical protein
LFGDEPVFAQQVEFCVVNGGVAHHLRVGFVENRMGVSSTGDRSSDLSRSSRRASRRPRGNSYNHMRKHNHSVAHLNHPASATRPYSSCQGRRTDSEHPLRASHR